MQITAYDLARRYLGLHELAGPGHDHPLIQWWLSLCGLPDSPDETPWCGAFLTGVAWELDLPRSTAAGARSWLTIGRPVALPDATIGYDVVVLRRGPPPQPDASVLHAPGHVGFFAGWPGDTVGGATLLLLSGNVADAVTISPFPAADVLGVRRLHVE